MSFMNKKLCYLQLLAKELNNPNVLTYEGFASLMNRIRTSVNEEEYLQIFSNTYQKLFVGYQKIATTMRRKVNSQYDSFDSEDLYEGIDLLVAYTIDAQLDSNHVYSKAEIQTLLNNKKIIIMMECVIDCSYEINEHKEAYQSFGTFDFNRMFDKESPYFTALLFYLKNNLTYDDVLFILQQINQQEKTDPEHVKKIDHSIFWLLK